jgi:AcrR family transcriptional regulator
MRNTVDRRTRKTREAIINAFVELMTEKDFEHLTINEIAERADVNRGTVYLHFVDKFDLLNQCTEVYLAQLVDSCLEEDAPLVPSKRVAQSVFNYLEQYASFYRILLTNTGVSSFRNRLLTLVRQIFARHVDLHAIDGTINKEITVEFLASAIVGVVEWWFMNSMPCPAEEVVDQVWALLESLQGKQRELQAIPTSSNIEREALR